VHAVEEADVVLRPADTNPALNRLQVLMNCCCVEAQPSLRGAACAVAAAAPAAATSTAAAGVVCHLLDLVAH
jgi:hypothetical protein